jgi:hypothetical protein
MKSEIENFFKGPVSALTVKLAELQQRIDPAAVAAKDNAYERLSSAIDEALRACDGLEAVIGNDPATLKEVQIRFREAISQWFDQSWFMYRPKIKPRGFVGDYEMLIEIYKRNPKSTGLGGYIDLYILSSWLGRAVPTRLQAAYEFLNEELSHRHGDVTILNVASGPFREYSLGFEYPSDCDPRFYCIDTDKGALEYVQSHLKPVSPSHPAVECVCLNAMRMTSVKANLEKFGWPDIIYSIGLCDYIPDDYMIELLRAWRESLNDNGVLYVAFKDCRRYGKTVYQWLQDWFFFQRNEEECRSLYEQAGFDMDELEMTRDETGIIMNFKSRVKTRKYVRIDAPELLQRKRRLAPVAAEETADSN